MSDKPLADQIETLASQYALDYVGQDFAEMAAELAKKSPPDFNEVGFNDFVRGCVQWLEKYPADVFTETARDPGAKFIVALRNAVEIVTNAQTTKQR